MLICVDGTGPGHGVSGKNRAANYAVSMMGSFVGLIYYGSHLPNRKYLQGPDLLGTGLNMVYPWSVYQRIREYWRQGDHRIFMTGYSRGAAILINTAFMMKDRHHRMPDGQYAEVEAMFLFDAVSRSVELTFTQTIPSNVKSCYHAMREDSTGSRRSFGHCGTTKEGGKNSFVTETFYTTHGGMGGVPWGEKGLPNLNKDIQGQIFLQATADAQTRGPLVFRDRFIPNEQAARQRVLSLSCIDEGFPDGLTNVTVAQEKAGSDAVHAWMWPYLRKHSVL